MKMDESFSAIKFKEVSQRNLSRKLSKTKSAGSYRRKISHIAESGSLGDWWRSLSKNSDAHKKAGA